mmetsp:Transcript_7237/g.13378  ORF Transcript_7237/g.13378 Transcript_7237/m.13378 type:complete len:344 (-) Transcript_7237:64-1095(-)
MLSKFNTLAENTLRQAQESGLQWPIFYTYANYTINDEVVEALTSTGVIQHEAQEEPSENADALHPGLPKPQYCKILYVASKDENAYDSLRSEEYSGNWDSQLIIGDAFPSISGLDTSSSERTQLSFTEADETVYLVTLWYAQYPPCLKHVQYYNDVLASHPEWEGKVQFVLLSKDENAEFPQKTVAEKGWSKLKSLWVEEDLPEGFQQFPVTFLVHKGKVVFKAQPQLRDVEKDVLHLLAGEALSADYRGNEAEPQLDEIAGKVKRLSDLLKEVKTELGLENSPYSSYYLDKYYFVGTSPKLSSRLTICGTFQESQKERLQALYGEIRGLFEGIEIVEEVRFE